MKKYIISLAIALGVLTVFSSCNDFLDRTPKGTNNIEDVTIESKVFANYVYMRNYNITSGISAFAIHLYRSEDSEKGSSATDGSDMAEMYDDFNYRSAGGTANSLSAYWNQNYKIILHSNQTLAAIDEEIADLAAQGVQPGEEYAIFRGELKFFRAYCYFNLVRAFGEVPLIDFDVKDSAEANIPKTSIEKIYELIDKDLTEAALHLETKKSWPSKFEGRLTWGAVRALHARTYMMRSLWQPMYDASLDVIGTGLYNLDTPSDKVFTDEGELCGESVFELVCMSTAALPGSDKIGSQFAQVQGVRGSGEWDLGWGWHMGTEQIGRAFIEHDPRKDATLLYFRRSKDDQITKENTNKPWGESPISNGMGSFFNKKVYTDPAMRAKYTKQGHWVNIRLIRYSDVLLMAAEAANELGNSSDAIKYLEEVRDRARKSFDKEDEANAGIDPATVLPKVTVTDKNEFRKKLMHERRVELALEFDRFYDLVRWGTAKEVLHAAGKTNYQDKHRYFPIPQLEIDKSNGVLIQNPDYQN